MTAAPTELTITDVTLRDGGYLNGHRWTREQCRAVVGAVSAAGVPRIEIGYVDRLAQGRPDHDDGPDPRELVEELVELAGPAAVLMMARPHHSVESILLAAKAGVRALRIPVAGADVASIRPLLDCAVESGLEVAVNLTRVSSDAPAELLRAAVTAERMGADVLYLADSNGSMTPVAVQRLVHSLRQTTPLPLGFHAHDNIGLAMANSLFAAAAGAGHLDASFAGIGKGGGNLTLELFLAYLRVRGATGYRLAPLAPLSRILRHEIATKAAQADAARMAGVLNLDHGRAEMLRAEPPEYLFGLIDAFPSPQADGLDRLWTIPGDTMGKSDD